MEAEEWCGYYKKNGMWLSYFQKNFTVLRKESTEYGGALRDYSRLKRSCFICK